MPKSLLHLLQFLLVQKHHDHKAYFQDVFVTLPVDASLEQVASEINTLSREVRLNRIVYYGLPHENPHVCRAALRRLATMLRFQMIDFAAMPSQSKGGVRKDQIVMALLETAAKYNGSTENEVLQSIAECFGELGAVNPDDLLDSSSSSSSSSNNNNNNASMINRTAVTAAFDLVIPWKELGVAMESDLRIPFALLQSHKSYVAFSVHLIRNQLLPLLHAHNRADTQNRAVFAIQVTRRLCFFLQKNRVLCVGDAQVLLR